MGPFAQAPGAGWTAAGGAGLWAAMATLGLFAGGGGVRFLGGFEAWLEAASLTGGIWLLYRVTWARDAALPAGRRDGEDVATFEV